MKKALLVLFVTFILAGCSEPVENDWGHIYLGRLNSIHSVCDSSNNYTTLLEVDNRVLTVVGQVQLRKKPHYYHIWINMAKRVVYLKRGSITLEYVWVWAKK